MREVLFRAKRKDNGEWIYGFFWKDIWGDGESCYILCDGESYPVISSTVGEYTGLTDKNGVKIFVGDIISYNKSREVVYFDISLRIPCFTTGIGGGSSTASHPYKISSRHVVIGNIHDNLSLLKGE